MWILPQSSKKEAAFFLKDDLYTNSHTKQSPLARQVAVLIHRTLKIAVLGT